MNPFEHSFSEAPVNVDIQRSRFSRNHSHKTTFNEGQLVPIFLDEVLPGDTFQMDMSLLSRMSTPVFPVMDNANIDVYFFFVPNRLVWEHWEEFCGENTTEPWTQSTEYLIPTVSIIETYQKYSDPDSGNLISDGLLSNYLGIPFSGISVESSLSRYSSPLHVNALPFRAYYLIWNEWFRDENLQYPINIYKGDNEVAFDSNLTNGFRFGHEPLPVARYPDYFSTCLPEPQKGPAVNLPLGASAPVRTSNTIIPIDSRYEGSILFSNPNDSSLASGVHNATFTTLAAPANNLAQLNVDLSSSAGSSYGVVPRNLFADLSEATASTVNELRQAFAVQRLFERDALGGTRYREMLKAHFGVTSPDSRMQIPEYLGGFRVPINVEEVIQTSSTSNVSPQGNASAFSKTVHSDSVFTKSFVEHGYIFGLACARVQHSYSQGLSKLWTRSRRFDFYYPALANIGNQPVYKRELLAGQSDSDSVFGYQEAWAEYRYAPNRVSGLFASSTNEFLETGSSGESEFQSWTYADFYESSPTLSDSWVRESDVNVRNTLAVATQPQFIADFYFKLDCTRPMPLYSIPGLIDHH